MREIMVEPDTVWWGGKRITYGARTFDLDSDLNADTFILMQSTGLLDNNGKEVFEGDIVVRSTKLYPSQKPDVIKWFDDWDHDLVGFQVCSKDEVIGNVYEHGHLLEVK